MTILIVCVARSSMNKGLIRRWIDTLTQIKGPVKWQGKVEQAAVQRSLAATGNGMADGEDDSETIVARWKPENNEWI